MAGTDVTMTASDGTPYQVYIAGDALPRRPAVILFTPIFGVDADIRAIADKWADRGYLVAAPDYFFRTAPGVLDRSENGRKLAMDRWKKMDASAVIADFAGLKAALLARPSCNGRLAALGYCAGGELAYLAATRLGAEAVAAFHATRIDQHLDEADKVAGRLTLHFGGNDPLVPLAQVDAIRARLSANPKADIHVYDGAGHGFSFSRQPSYHAVAESNSDKRAQDVLATLKDAA